MHRLMIQTDSDPIDPREEGVTVGTMVCWHRHYTLGDEQPGCTPDEYLFRLAANHDGFLSTFDEEWITATRQEIVAAARETARAELDYVRHDGAQSHGRFRTAWGHYRTAQQMARKGDGLKDVVSEVLEEHYVILPLYLYDHSGITISTGPFGCPWDSGEIGFIFVSKEDARKNYGSQGEAVPDEIYWESCLRDEVEVYDYYLTGQCYGFTLEEGEERRHVVRDVDGEFLDGWTEIEWTTVDSCWGFLGELEGEGGVLANIKHHLDEEGQALVDAFDYTKLDEWVYSADVDEEHRE